MWTIPTLHCSRQLQVAQAQPQQLVAEHPTSLTPFISPQSLPLSCMAVSSTHSLAAFSGQQGLLRLCPLNPAALRSDKAWLTSPPDTLPAQDVCCLAWCSTPDSSGFAFLAAGCGSLLVCSKWWAPV